MAVGENRKMKAIMISIKPKWCAKIMNGEKTIEVRKSKALANAIQKLIDENGYAEIHAYCTKDAQGLYWARKWIAVSQKETVPSHRVGKVVFKFQCHKVEEFYEFNNDLCEKACIGRGEILDYLGDESGYAIHISKLEIYDKPKELREFSNRDPYPYTRRLTRAPQSWQYVEAEESWE